MDIKLVDDNMKDIIAKAILDTLTPENRSELISNAVKALLITPTGERYNTNSPLQRAFDDAVGQVAREIAREQIVGNTEIKAKITQLIADSWEKLVNHDNYSKMVEKVAGAIESGLTGDRY